MLENFENLKKKYDELQKKLVDPEILKDVTNIKIYSKELKDLEPIIKKYEILEKEINELKEARELLVDEKEEEVIEMLNGIIDNALKTIPLLEEEIKILLLPKDPNDGKDVIMEIRGAAGGDEANIFAGDLFRMYKMFSEIKGWKIQILDANESETGGYSLISFSIKGEDVYSKLKFESGSHRVQRIPKTDSQGRIHTSTATVILLPEIDDIEIEILDSDIRIDVYRSSGPGGQGVNTTDSAVRVTHLETGIVSASQTERSQIKNKEIAMKMLRAKVYDYYYQQQLEKSDATRKNKVGTGARSEKIRTYNYPQNRVTDHRIGLTLNKLDQVMNGKLDEIVDKLILEEQMELLANNE